MSLASYRTAPLRYVFCQHTTRCHMLHRKVAFSVDMRVYLTEGEVLSVRDTVTFFLPHENVEHCLAQAIFRHHLVQEVLAKRYLLVAPH